MIAGIPGKRPRVPALTSSAPRAKPQPRGAGQHQRDEWLDVIGLAQGQSCSDGSARTRSQKRSIGRAVVAARRIVRLPGILIARSVPCRIVPGNRRRESHAPPLSRRWRPGSSRTWASCRGRCRNAIVVPFMYQIARSPLVSVHKDIALAVAVEVAGHGGATRPSAGLADARSCWD